MPPKKNIDVFQEMIRESTRLLKDKFKLITEWMDLAELQIMMDENLKMDKGPLESSQVG